MKNRIDIRGMSKSFFATCALDQVDFACAGGEVHALVERCRQVDPDEDPRRRVSGRRGADLDERRGGPDRQPRRCDRPWRQHDPSGIFADQRADHRRRYFSGERAEARTPFLDKAEMARQVREQLDRFGLDLDPHRPVRELNSGEKQIVEIISALMSNSWLIVMDEPTFALSEEDKERLFTSIQRMTDEGIAIIYISHHMPEIFGIADRVTVMRDGCIVLSEATAETSEDAVIHAMTGKELENFVKPHKQIADEVLVSVSGLSKPGMFEDISFDVRRGEIVVMTGLRGCGGPELAKAIFGLDKDYAGDIRYRGELLQPGRGPDKAVRDGMGLVTENRDKNGILAALSVRDNIALPFLEKSRKNGLIDGAAIETLVTRAIQDTSTKTSSPDQEIRFLSGGNKQKICFSRWLDPDLEFLILLEPTRGIDVHAKADIYRIIKDMAERGVGILVLSYEIDEVLMLADRILTFYQGVMIGEQSYPDFDKARMLADMAGAQ